MDAKELALSLTKVKVFNSFTSEEIVNMLEICRKKSFTKGDYLLKEGHDADEIYILISGSVEVLTDSSYTATIDQNEVVGEMGAITARPRASSVIALEETETLVFSHQELMARANQHPQLAIKLYRNIIITLSHRLRCTNSMAEMNALL